MFNIKHMGLPFNIAVNLCAEKLRKLYEQFIAAQLIVHPGGTRAPQGSSLIMVSNVTVNQNSD